MMSFSEIEIYLKKKLDPSIFEIYKNLNLRDLINSANGSPKKVLIDVDQDNRFLLEVDFRAVTLSNNMYQSSGTNGSSFFFWKNKVEYSFGFLPPGSMNKTSD